MSVLSLGPTVSLGYLYFLKREETFVDANQRILHPNRVLVIPRVNVNNNRLLR